jgi:hypothetical protein
MEHTLVENWQIALLREQIREKEFFREKIENELFKLREELYGLLKLTAAFENSN